MSLVEKNHARYFLCLNVGVIAMVTHLATG
jgi:hypothetical protein